MNSLLSSLRIRAHLGEQKNISMFYTCSELTPRAPIPDGRMTQIMQPCSLIKKMTCISTVRISTAELECFTRSSTGERSSSSTAWNYFGEIKSNMKFRISESRINVVLLPFPTSLQLTLPLYLFNFLYGVVLWKWGLTSYDSLHGFVRC